MAMFDMLLARLRSQSPEKYKAFMAIKNSGKDPMQVLSDMYQRGELSDRQLTETANMMARMGKPVPKSELDRIRSSKRSQPTTATQSDPKKPNGFKGWF